MIPRKKGAIVTLTRTLAQELGPHGITVNNIPPGSVMGTLMSEASRGLMQMPEEQLIKNIPVRHTGVADDIANVNGSEDIVDRLPEHQIGRSKQHSEDQQERGCD